MEMHPSSDPDGLEVLAVQRAGASARTPPSGQPLVLATHYDSVSAGPGAADAGSCVAALLETARALQHGGPYRRPVYLLITDGEEMGLLGPRRLSRNIRCPARNRSC